MRHITIEIMGHTISLPENERITIIFHTSVGKFEVTAPIDIAFAAAAKAFRK
jgi:hypothetical protein